MSKELLLELHDISKFFPGIKALDKVHFDLRQGEIHAIMGENGAGKSTFIKIITGVHAHDKGEIYYQGKKIVFHSPKHALDMGISAIYQHATSYPHLTVVENIFMGHEKVSKILKRIQWKNMKQKAQELLDEIGADFSINDLVENLSVAQQQMVEIAKALSVDAKIVIMDEPTASLTKKESEELYEVAENLRNRGVGVIFVSHRMEDVYRLADRVTVFRDAKYIDTWDMGDVSEQQLIFAMVGREISQLYPTRDNDLGDIVLKGEGLSKVGWFTDVNFEVRSGEIVSFTGLIGAGRTEVFQALVGINTLDEGKVYIDGKLAHITHPSESLKLGITYLPEDRQLQGLIMEWSLVHNVSLTVIDELSKHLVIDVSREYEIANTLLDRTEVKAGTLFDKASSLSGGNQQKVVISKLLSKKSKVIILDEPTKGVDVGAKAAIYLIINDLAKQGYAIILISSEMPEVLGMSDRIIVMRSGRVTKEFKNNALITQEMVLEVAMLSHKSKMEQVNA